MTTPSVSITLTGSPASSQPSSPVSENARPSLGNRASSWSGVANYTMAPRRPSLTDTSSGPGGPNTTLEALTEPEGALSRLSLAPGSRNVSLKQSLDAGRAPSARAAAGTPLTAMDKVFDVPASEGLAERLKELTRQTNTSVLEVLRRLSEAERQSSMVRASSTNDELRDVLPHSCPFRSWA